MSPVYLNVGTLIHQGSQSWLLDSERKLSYEDHVTVASDKLLERAQAKYLRQVHAPMSKDEEGVLYESIYFARTMAKNYETHWGTPLPEGFVVIRPEQHVMVPVKGTEHDCEYLDAVWVSRSGGSEHMIQNPDREFVLCPGCSGSGVEVHYLDGRFDGLIQDAAGRIYILEHKTYKTRPKVKALENNDQFLAYTWLATQLGVGDVMGVAYDGLWRRDAVPKGRTFEELFLRVIVQRSRAELAEFERMLPNELNMMAVQLAARSDPYINRRWQGCFDCAFDDRPDGRTGLCSAISRHENVDAVRQLYYAERDDDIEDDDAETETAA